MTAPTHIVKTKDPAKRGDTLVISGRFTAFANDAKALADLYTLAYWNAATIVVNVWNEAGVLVVNRAALTSLDTSDLSADDSLLPRYRYVGDTSTPAGKYQYELEVTSGGIVRTWSNNKSRHFVDIIPDGG